MVSHDSVQLVNECRKVVVRLGLLQDLDTSVDDAYQRHPVVNVSHHVHLFILGSHVSTLPVWEVKKWTNLHK